MAIINVTKMVTGLTRANVLRMLFPLFKAAPPFGGAGRSVRGSDARGRQCQCVGGLREGAPKFRVADATRPANFAEHERQLRTLARNRRPGVGDLIGQLADGPDNLTRYAG